MISERQFAKLFQNFWRPFSPGLRSLIKEMNSRAWQYTSPVSKLYSPSKRALSSELGFRAFCLRMRNHTGSLSIYEAMRACEADTASYITRLQKLEDDHESGLSETPFLDDEVRKDAVIQCEQLEKFCTSNRHSKQIEIEPKIPGCGIIDTCTGDILVDRELYESKSRIGPFEQADLRQLLIYSILSFISDPMRIEKIGLLNPYRGVRTQVTLSAAIHAIANLSVLEFSVLTINSLTMDLSSH